MANSYYHSLKIGGMVPTPGPYEASDSYLKPLSLSTTDMLSKSTLLLEKCEVAIQEMQFAYDKLPETANFINFLQYKNGLKLEVDNNNTLYKQYNTTDMVKNYGYINRLETLLRSIQGTKNKLLAFLEQVEQLVRYRDAAGELIIRIKALEKVINDKVPEMGVPVLMSIANSILTKLSKLVVDTNNKMSKIADVIVLEQDITQCSGQFTRIETYWNATINVNLHVVIQRCMEYIAIHKQIEDKTTILNHKFTVETGKLNATFLPALKGVYIAGFTPLSAYFVAAVADPVLLDPLHTDSIVQGNVVTLAFEADMMNNTALARECFADMQYVEHVLEELMVTTAHITAEIVDVQLTFNAYTSILNKDNLWYIEINGRAEGLKQYVTRLRNFKLNALADIDFAGMQWDAYNAVVEEFRVIKAYADALLPNRDELMELRSLRQDITNLKLRYKTFITQYLELRDIYVTRRVNELNVAMTNQSNLVDTAFSRVTRIADIDRCLQLHRQLRQAFEDGIRSLASDQRIVALKSDSAVVNTIIAKIKANIDVDTTGYIAFMFSNMTETKVDTALHHWFNLKKTEMRDFATEFRRTINAMADIQRDLGLFRTLLTRIDTQIVEIGKMYQAGSYYTRLKKMYTDVNRMFGQLEDMEYEDLGDDYATINGFKDDINTYIGTDVGDIDTLIIRNAALQSYMTSVDAYLTPEIEDAFIVTDNVGGALKYQNMRKLVDDTSEYLKRSLLSELRTTYEDTIATSDGMIKYKIYTI